VSCGTDILYDWLIRTFLGRVKRSSKHCQSSLVNGAGKLVCKCAKYCVKIRNGLQFEEKILIVFHTDGSE
jgi:hypothetical protein